MRVVDPRQTYVEASVDLARIREGVVLHPGTRLQGARTFLGRGAEVGREGPATLVDVVLGAGARLDSGYAREAVLLRGASLGSNAHVRPGTLLEEEASTAHAVGLKHTILLGFVTLGSLINLCDCLIAGGSSRRDHSEVGSGYIHFNFTPWGEHGDKATPSLVGDVVRGVFLREARIFLGGSGGMIGPMRVGFGSVVAAGQVLRRDVQDERVVLQERRAFDLPRRAGRLGGVDDRTRRNVEYIAQVVALRAWYRQVRLARCAADDTDLRPTIEAAIEVIDLCVRERIEQIARFRSERRVPPLSFELDALPACPLALPPPGERQSATADHVDWVRSLPDDEIEHLRAWLSSIAEQVERGIEQQLAGA